MVNTKFVLKEVYHLSHSNFTSLENSLTITAIAELNLLGMARTTVGKIMQATMCDSM